MAYRISFWIVIFLICFNGGALLLETSGAADYMGVEPSTGSPEQLEEAKDSAKNFDTGEGSGDTLFGLANSLMNPLETIFNTIFPGGEMLINVGVPAYLVTFCLTALSIIPGYDAMQFLRGT